MLPAESSTIVCLISDNMLGFFYQIIKKIALPHWATCFSLSSKSQLIAVGSKGKLWSCIPWNASFFNSISEMKVWSRFLINFSTCLISYQSECWSWSSRPAAGSRTFCSTATHCRHVTSLPLGLFCSLWLIMRSCCGRCGASEGHSSVFEPRTL